MDSNLKLKLHHENLLKNFTKDSFQNKISKTLQSQSSNKDLQTFDLATIQSKNDIESLIFQRIHNLDPKKKHKITHSLHSQFQNLLKSRNNKAKYSNPTLSVNEFLTYVQRIPAKILNETLNFKEEYNKKVSKLNDIYNENCNKSPLNLIANRSSNLQTNNKKPLSIFSNENLIKTERNKSINLINTIKKSPDSIPSKPKEIDLEINQITNKSLQFNKKSRAQSAYDRNNFTILSKDNTEKINSLTKEPSVYEFQKRYYRMQDLDNLLAKSLTISEKNSHKDYEKNQLLRGVLRNSSNLNYHMDAVFRTIEKGKNKAPQISPLQMEAIKEKMLKNFRKMKENKMNNTQKLIENKIKNIEKMLIVDSGVLKYHKKIRRPQSAQAQTEQNSSKKKLKNLPLRSEVMKKFKIAELSTDHSVLAKKSKVASSATTMKNMSYVNYFL